MNGYVEENGVVHVLTVSDADEWRAYLPASRNVFGSVEFARIVQAHTGYPARLFVYQTGAWWVAYPFFLRGVADLPFTFGEQTGWDAFTPNYTGPICNRLVRDETPQAFRRAFSRYCRREGIVTEFAHLHPWDSCMPLLNPSGVTFDRQIIFVDLIIRMGELWNSHLSRSCKKNIKRALRENVHVFAATTADEIREFHRVYTATMERNRADLSYFFPLEYLMAFHATMRQHARFMLASYKGKIIAGTLYLHDDRNIYSYLGGADHEFQQVRPTNALIYQTIRWGQWQGISRLILGGGYRPDDGIFRFKATFSPLSADFHTYRQIHHDDNYRKLYKSWATYYGRPQKRETFFPAYRAVPAA